VWPLRRLTCTDAKIASPHLIAPRDISIWSWLADCRRDSHQASELFQRCWLFAAEDDPDLCFVVDVEGEAPGCSSGWGG
jgi:hypothetical protein